MMVESGGRMPQKNANIGTIYYLIPNIQPRDTNPINLAKAIFKGRLVSYIQSAWFPKHKPIGGIKVMLQHCLLLQELGYNAHPLALGRYKGNFFGYPLAFKKIKDIGFKLGNNDVVICSEVFPYDAFKFERARKVLFAQNFIHLYQIFDEQDRDKSFKSLGYDAVMCCSEFIRSKLTRDPDAYLVNNYIDLSRFVQKPELRKPKRVLALPRKNPSDLQDIVQRSQHLGLHFEFADGLSEQELIAEYQQADIFLATGYPEGFGLPPLEAMACGAAVVGFAGGGALEFMKDGETALVVADGDTRAAAKALERMVLDNSLKEAVRSRGQQMAQTYGQDKSQRQLARFFHDMAIAPATDDLSSL